MTRKVSAILFDLDGVLVDATEWHYEALNRALGLFGFGISRHEHLSHYNGLPTCKKLQMLTAEAGLPPSLHDTIRKLKQVWTKTEILTKCRPTFEKEYLLSRLRQEGFRLAVCSNAIRETVHLMLERALLVPYLDLTLTNEDVVDPKPSPAIYQKAMQMMDVLPEETVIVEDAPHGIRAARATGAHVCAVQGFHEVDYVRVREFIDAVPVT